MFGRKHIRRATLTPVEAIADQIRRLTYEELMGMAGELHRIADETDMGLAHVLNVWAKQKRGYVSAADIVGHTVRADKIKPDLSALAAELRKAPEPTLRATTDEQLQAVGARHA